MFNETKDDPNKKNRYFHEECYPKHLKEKEFKKRERKELDELYETIKDVHKLEVIPNSFFPYLQELRNGSKLWGNIKSGYKKGVRYKALQITYEYCRDTIQTYKTKKEFKDTLSELRYGLAIVRNHIDDAKRDYRKKLKQQTERADLDRSIETLKRVEQGLKNKQVTNKDENNKVDITTLFD